MDWSGVECSAETDDRIISYANLLTELRDHHEGLVDPLNDTLASKLDLVDRLQKGFKQDHEEQGSEPSTTEVCYDGMVFNLIASYGQQKIQAINAEVVKFDPVEFADKIRCNIINGDEDTTHGNLLEFGRKCLKLVRNPPQWQILFGALDRSEVVRKPVAERKKRPADPDVARKTRPEKLDSFKGANEDDATTAEVSHMFSCLRRLYKNDPERRVLFWEFILDPQSYSRTVENLFHVAFLIRDNRVSVKGDEPVIRPLAKKPDGHDQSVKVTRRQECVNMSYAYWEIDELKDKERIISELEKELGYQKSKYGHTKTELGREKAQVGQQKQIDDQRPEPSQAKRDSAGTNGKLEADKQKSPQHKPSRNVTSPLMETKDKKNMAAALPKSPKKVLSGSSSPKMKRSSDKLKAQEPSGKTNLQDRPVNLSPSDSTGSGSTKQSRDHALHSPTSPRLTRNKLTANGGTKSGSPVTPTSPRLSPRAVNQSASGATKARNSPPVTPTSPRPQSRAIHQTAAAGGAKESSEGPSQQVDQATTDTAKDTSRPSPPTSPRLSTARRPQKKVHPGVVDPRFRRKRWTPSASFNDTLEAVQEGGDDSPSGNAGLAAAGNADLWTTAEADERYKLLMKEHLDLEKAFTALQCDLPLDPLTMVQERYQLEQDLLSAHNKIMQLERQTKARAGMEDDGGLKRERYQLIGRNRHLQSRVSDLEDKLMSLEEALSESHEEIEDWEFRVLELEQELATSAKVEDKQAKEPSPDKAIETDEPPFKESPTKDTPAKIADPQASPEQIDRDYVDKWSHVSAELKLQGISVRDVMKELDELRNSSSCASSDQEKITLLEAQKIMDILDKCMHNKHEQQCVEIVPCFNVLSVSDSTPDTDLKP